MSKQHFKLHGVKEFKAALNALGPEIATKEAVKVSRKVTNVMRDEVRKKAPYDPSDTRRTWRTADGIKREADYGHLRNNIKTRKVRAKKLHTVSFVITTGKAFWGRFLEFGTIKLKAQPFFKPAVDSSASKAIDTLMSEMRKAVENAARKHRKP